MSFIREHDRLVLVNDLPAEKLVAGDIGTVVHVHADNRAFEVEFVAQDGHVAMVTLDQTQVRSVEHQ